VEKLALVAIHVAVVDAILGFAKPRLAKARVSAVVEIGSVVAINLMHAVVSSLDKSVNKTKG